MSTFSKKTNIILTLIGVLCIVVSTIGGVFTANRFVNVRFGSSVETGNLESLDVPPIDGSVNFLLLGVDEGGMRSDTMMLVSLNGKTNEVNIISIPRDTAMYVSGSMYKINSAIGIGAQEVRRGRMEEPEDYTIKKVKELTGLPVHFFMTIDFDGFKEVIDILGGVDFDVPFHMKYDDPIQNLHIDLKPGMQHLDGEAAHDFIRFRQGNPGYHGYAMGDLGRIDAQQEFLKALIKQKLKPEYIAKASELYEAMCEYVRTNYAVKDLLGHLGTISKIKAEKVTMYQLPGEARMINGGSYFVLDADGMKELRETVFLK